MTNVEMYPLQHYMGDVIIRCVERANSSEPKTYLKRIETGVLNEDAVRMSIRCGTPILAPLNWLNYMEKIGKVRVF